MIRIKDTTKNQILSVIDKVKKDGRLAFLEPEGFEILQLLGVNVPKYFYIKDLKELDNIDISGWQKAVIKVVSPKILHKTDVGGVKVVDARSKYEIYNIINAMSDKFKGMDLRGFMVCEFVPYEHELGGEFLFGVRQTPDFGPVLTIGAGGIYTEFLASKFKEDVNVSFVPLCLYDDEYLEAVIDKVAILDLVTKSHRNQTPKLDKSKIIDMVKKLSEFALVVMEHGVQEFEINPAVIYNQNLYALDILIKLTTDISINVLYHNEEAGLKNKPTYKIQNLLMPKTAAVIGVSEKTMNPGRIILNNFIERGFDRQNLYVIKRGVSEIDGCRCVDDIADLDVCVDLLVLAIPATDVPEIIEKVIMYQKANSIIVIPGGLEEKSGSDMIVRKMYESLRNSRQTPWGGPVINGGNCLGIVSRAGKYDTMFIPKYKIPPLRQDVKTPLAFISQSGAFAISRLNKFFHINPKYTITIGNQMDLTMGDYLEFLAEDSEIKIYALYLEGFKPRDGIKVLSCAQKIVRSQRHVIFYCAGRTAEGARAMASHTASIAGDYAVIRKIFISSGVIVAQTFEEFEDYIKIFSYLNDYPISSHARIGVISNAGCECVAASDNLGIFKLSNFSKYTQEKLHSIFVKAKIDSIVDVHNPIDLTPMSNDAVYEEVSKTVLDDPNTDVVIISCVPLSPVINALAPSSTLEHKENYLDASSIVQRLIKLKEYTKKPMLCVVDAGSLYDSMVNHLEEHGIVTFRTIDRALKVLNTFYLSKLRYTNLSSNDV